MWEGKGESEKLKWYSIQEIDQMEVFFSSPNRKHQNTIPLQKHTVANYVKSPWTHPERGLFSFSTKSGSREVKSG